MHKNRLYLILLSLFLFGSSFATEQWLDIIKYKNRIHGLYSSDLITGSQIRGYPLEPLIYNSFKDESNKYKLDSLLKVTSWHIRGYVAEWEIRNDSLLLMDVKHGASDAISVSLQYIFDDKNVENGVFADWFTGRLMLLSEEYPPYAYIALEKNIKYTLFIEKGCVIYHKEDISSKI